MASGQGLIKARRRLTALFRTGVEIRFGGRYGTEGQIAPKGEGFFVEEDGTTRIPLIDKGDDSPDTEVAMWVQPPSPIHRDMALRDANAARARSTLAIKRDTDSEEHLVAMEFIETMSEETLYEYVLLADVEERRQEAIREVLGEEEWKDITELQDSIRVFEEEERADDDPEVVAVREREEELGRQVAEREKDLREAALEVLKMRGVEAAKKKAAEKRGDLVSSRAFMAEYERQMSFYSVRDPDDHGVMFFESAREFAEQPDEVLDLVQKAVEPFIKDGGEAKNSQRAESGSDSSDLPRPQETSGSSTPEESSE